MGAFCGPADAKRKNVRCFSRGLRPNCFPRKSPRRCAAGLYPGKYSPFLFQNSLITGAWTGPGLYPPRSDSPSKRPSMPIGKPVGFPRWAGLDRRLRIKIHQEYFEAVLFRDLIERHNISHPRALMDLAHRLMENISSLYSINSLTGYLKSLGHKVPKSAVSDYLQWFEDAYFLFTMPLFDASITRSKANPKKDLLRGPRPCPFCCFGHSPELRSSAGKISFFRASGVSRSTSFMARQRAVTRLTLSFHRRTDRHG